MSTTTQQIAVIDYHMGNLRSVSKAVEHVAENAEVRVTDDHAYIKAADRIVFMKDGLVYWEGTPVELKANKDPVLVKFIEGRSEDSDL